MQFFDLLRKYSKARFFAGLFLVGILFLGIGGMILSHPATQSESAEGTIVAIREYENFDETEYQVLVNYVDAQGNLYEGVVYPSYNSGMRVGNTVEVLYDPADPYNISSPDARFLPWIILAVGIACIAAAGILVPKAIREAKDGEVFYDQTSKADPEIAREIAESDEPSAEYYFHFTGKMNQSYILETPERAPVYEAVCDRIGVFRPYLYTFVDHRYGTRGQHTVTHTVTKSYGGGHYVAVDSSCFKIDGEDCWAHLGREGYSVRPDIDGIRLNFDVLKHGVPVARLEAAGVNILRDDKQYALGDKLPGTGLFRITCRESDLPQVFFAAFAASRVEFF